MTKGLFSIEFNIREINGVFDDMSNAYKSATVNTLNKVGRLANREAANHIKKNYNIKAGDLKIGNNEIVRLRRANKRKGVLGFIIYVVQRRRGLIQYGAKQTKKGIKVKIKKRAVLIKGAFISTWRSGESNKFAFRRNPKKFYQKKKSLRMKRRVLYGLSIANLYGSRKVLSVIEETVNSKSQRVLDEEFNKQFEKKK